MYVCAFQCTTCVWVHMSPEEGIWSLGAGVTVVCNPPVPINTGNQTQFLFKSSKHFLRLSHLCSPWKMVLYILDTWRQEPSTSPLLTFSIPIIKSLLSRISTEIIKELKIEYLLENRFLFLVAQIQLLRLIYRNREYFCFDIRYLLFSQE